MIGLFHFISTIFYTYRLFFYKISFPISSNIVIHTLLRRLLENLRKHSTILGINNYRYIQSHPYYVTNILQIYIYIYAHIEFIQISIMIINNNYIIDALNVSVFRETYNNH